MMRHRRRKGTSVTPAMGARTTGVHRRSGPTRSGAAADVEAICKSAAQAFDQVRLDLVERDAHLLHRVTLTDGDGVVSIESKS